MSADDRDRPPISVLMPVYNAGRYVAEAVESILAQTLDDFEFLIVDDGSTDRSGAILEAYAARDPRIRLTRRENRGLVASLNEMIAEARGGLLARMDADDIALPDRFALQADYLRAHPEVACVGGGYVVIDARGRTLVRLRLPEDDATLQDLALSGHVPINHPTVMMRRGAVLAAGGYRAEMFLAEDLDLWLRLGERGLLANLPEAVLKYREHEASVSHANHRAQLERIRAAVDEACDRRGLPRRGPAPRPFRPVGGRSSRHAYSLRNGWWAFNSGERSTALRYGLQAIRRMPWRPEGWKLLACAALKPARPAP